MYLLWSTDRDKGHHTDANTTTLIIIFFFIYTPIIIWKNGIIQYNYIYRCQTSNTDAVLHSVFNLKFGPIFGNNLVQREYNSVNSKNKNFTHPYLFKHPIQHSLSKNNKQWNSKYIHNFKTFLNTNIHQNKFNIEDWIRVLSNYQIPHKKNSIFNSSFL
jgi:hypothetical protein